MSGLVLDGAAARDPTVAGGKAARLAALAAAGHDVPPFLVLASDALDAPDAASVSTAAALALGPGPFAVRSSAVGEDGEDSHAGQFLSVLGVAPAYVHAEALRVRASGGEAGVMAYRSRRGGGEGRPAVIVQAMVPARVAGVVFSADPATGRRDVCIVSAVGGLADRLVGGEDDGETWRFDRRRRQVIDGPTAGVLSTADLAAVVALAERIESEAGRPQDVEWAFESDRLRVLQARAITTPLRAVPVPDADVAVLDNANIVESYPGLVSPLTFSFAVHAYSEVYHAFMALLGVPAKDISQRRALFDNMLVRHEGRVYYRLDNWYRAIALLPGYRLNSGFMEGMMGTADPLPPGLAERLGPPPLSGAARIAEVLRLGRTGLGILWAAARLGRLERAFEGRLDAASAAATRDAVDRLPLTGLAALYRRIESDLLDRWDAPIVNDLLCMIAFGGSRALATRWLADGATSLHDAFMTGQGGIVSAEPAARIRAMGALAAHRPDIVVDLAAGRDDLARTLPALSAALDAYVEKFGDRCAEELKLKSPTLHDDPTSLRLAVAGAAGRRSAATAPETVDPEAELRRRLAGAPVKRAALLVAMRYARARVRGRENLRFERTRIFGAARRVFLAMGRQFHALGLVDDPRDILLLTVPEALGAIEGGGSGTDLRALAALRRAEGDRYAAAPDPPRRIVVEGAVATAAASPPSADPVAGHEAIRVGIGVSPGRAAGTARVVADPRAGTIAPGEILVARHTDPGWIALFANAGAIVTERGSPLSHSAIVARELGIPCVVALPGAMDWIADGEPVTIDGSSGEVRRTDA